MPVHPRCAPRPQSATRLLVPSPGDNCPHQPEGRQAMSTALTGTTVRAPAAPPPAPKTYLDDTTGVLSWLLTKDHKRIAILYLLTLTFTFFVGGLTITIVRLHLMVPNGNLVTADTFNRLFTIHGVVM